MEDAKESLDICRLREEKTYSNLSGLTEISCTLLKRGVRNYYPEGVKAKKVYSPVSNYRQENLFSSKSSSPDSLSFKLQAIHPTFQKRSRNHQRYNREESIDFSASATFSNQTPIEPMSSGQEMIFSKSFRANKIFSNFNEQNSEYNDSSCDLQSFSPNDESSQLRCESVETFFPNIFASPFFSGRSAVRNGNIPDVDLHNDAISPLSSSRSDATSSSISETIEDQIFSSENSMMSDDNNTCDEATKTFGFKVHVRIKPLEDQDVVGGASSSRLRCVQVKGKQNLVLCTRPSMKKENTSNNHWFKFDQVYSESASQKDTYDVTTQPLVDMVLKGYQACLIAYGSPGSGKSYSLFGKASSGKHKGLIIRAAEALMASIDKSTTDESKTEVSMSFIQIYNEKLYDILDPSATDNIKFHDAGDVHSLEGITEWPVETTEDVTKQLRRNPNRLRDAGKSHIVFTLLYRKEVMVGEDEESGIKSYRTTAGRLDFVDLAGVNRPTKHSTYDSTGNNATAKANRSLQVFSNVIWALTDSKNSQVPPFKDSRLTRILREALGGNYVTRLLVTALSCPNSAHETLNCLAFAKRAMGVKNFPAPCVSEARFAKQNSCEISVDDNASEIFTQQTNAVNLSEESDKYGGGVEISKSKTVTEENSVRTLPPINSKNSLSTHDPSEFNAASKNPQIIAEETLSTSSKTNLKQNEILMKRKSCLKENLDSEISEVKKINDKSKRAKRRLRNSKNYDMNLSQDGSVTQEASTVKDGLTLPQIDTPDLTRHQGFSSVDSHNYDGKNRAGKALGGKQSSLTENSSSREFDATKYLKERPTSSNSLTSSQSSRLADKVCAVNTELNERKEVLDYLNSKISSQIFNRSDESTNCCVICREREEKIKRDYDRMILFSKKDRDMKQTRIEELEVLLKKARSESAPLAEVQRLTEEKVKDHQALKKQKELVEVLKNQLASMVSANDWGNLQEMRRKDATEIEKLKEEITTLQNNLKEQIDGASKMLAKKSEQLAKQEAEVAVLRKKAVNSHSVKTSNYDNLLLQLDQMQVEKEQLKSKHQTEIKEIAFKLECATAQISQLQETKAEFERIFSEEKEILEREIYILKQKVAELTKSKKKQEILQNISLKCDAGTNTEDLKSRLNGLAYTIHCLKCAAERSLFDNDEQQEVPTLQDAEIRILLLQDNKNRELLLQLKRERNLLRDVMKIMYCRQWFTEEGNPHVKRTLRQVGIDIKELATMKK